MHVEFSYVAVKPIRAEHPVGSGKIVTYQPGDVIPAGDWGRAADNLVELGKAAMLAVNVPDGNEPPIGETATAVSSLEAHYDQSTRPPALHVTQSLPEEEPVEEEDEPVQDSTPTVAKRPRKKKEA